MLKFVKHAFSYDFDCSVVPLQPRKDERNAIAVVACGDFNAHQEAFLKLEGVERVILGYTGGGTHVPTFHKIHDHTEALLIEFNPQIISYSQILVSWRECIDPWEKEKTQHRAAIFWSTLTQQNLALEFIGNLQSKKPSKALHVKVERARRFFRAKQTYPLLPVEPNHEGNEVAVVATEDISGLISMLEETGGVERIVTGLTGGKQEHPKDFKPLDHTVALFIEFIPTKVSYRQILELWHECDDPWEEETTSQTRSVIFWKTLRQQDEALQFAEVVQAKKPSAKVFVDIERVHKFYEVEIYPNADTIVSPQQKNNASVSDKLSLEDKLAAGQKPCLSELTNPVWKTNRN